MTLVSGSYPPEVCGIGHYSCHLAKALKQAGANVEVVAGQGWGVSRLRETLRLAAKSPDKLLHIQYPGEGYGWSLTPQLLTMARPAVVTLHEFSRASLLRKLSLLPFLVAARRLIFTSDFELKFAARWIPSIKTKSTIIEIGSNIPFPALPPPRILNQITYFGLIVPNKGIEDVLRLASLVQQRLLPIQLRIIGATMPRFTDYALWLAEQSKGLPIELNFDLDDEATGKVLATSAVAYLPFPGGASIRRGSLKALLACGTAVITTRGPQTTSPLADTLLFAEGPDEALDLSLKLFSDQDRLATMSAASSSYSKTYGWETIAAEHLEVYRRFLQRSPSHVHD